MGGGEGGVWLSRLGRGVGGRLGGQEDVIPSGDRRTRSKVNRLRGTCTVG